MAGTIENRKREERGLILSGPMVRAILEGRKTQTRRVVSQKCDHFHRDIVGKESYTREDWDRIIPQAGEKEIKCPYGIPGDRLYVREAFALYRTRAMSTYEDGSPKSYWQSDGEGDPAVLYRADMRTHEGWTRADGDVQIQHSKTTLEKTDADRWKPSIHMPKWASRIWLEIVGVRVERVQEISEEDARAEGVDGGMACETSWRATFRWLWDELNEKRGYGWDTNPWVWVIVFRRWEKS